MPIRATIVNHVAVNIAASPNAVWQLILNEYVEGDKFRAMGYTVETIDDPAAVLGGYRIRLAQDGNTVDERVCYISERDDPARRLSVFADYLSVPGGMQVYATYHAKEAADGTTYALDCHARLNIDEQTNIVELKEQADGSLGDYLNGIKSRLEGCLDAG